MRVSTVLTLLAAGQCLCTTSLSAQTPSRLDNELDAPPALPSSRFYGRIESDYYLSPTGAFRIKIPVLPELGGTVTDTANVVTFDDDFSTHCSVGAFPLSPELRSEYERRGAQAFLIDFFTNLVIPDFAARYPGATIEDVGSYLPEFQGGSMLVFTLLPGGSFFEQQVEIWPPKEPVIAKRGNLCFVKNNYVFVVSLELAERALERSTYHLTIASGPKSRQGTAVAATGLAEVRPAGRGAGLSFPRRLHLPAAAGIEAPARQFRPLFRGRSAEGREDHLPETRAAR
jgi:hypothetical protein